MKLAKASIDLGVRSNDLQSMLDFYQRDVGLAFVNTMETRPGQVQHRHDANGTLIKVNHHTDPLPPHPRTGYREIIIAREGLSEVMHLSDPEGVPITLAPPGHEGVEQLGVRLAVRDMDVHRRFYADVVGLPEVTPGVFAAMDSRIILAPDPQASDDSDMLGVGFRYITFQVADGVGEHARMVAAGAREARAPILGRSAAVVSVSMLRDPDGNWIELLQRP